MEIGSFFLDRWVGRRHIKRRFIQHERVKARDDVSSGVQQMDLTCNKNGVGISGPNLEPGTMRVYITNGPQNGLNIGRTVGPCPGSRSRWVVGNVHAFSQAVHDANTYRPRFQVRARPS